LKIKQLFFKEYLFNFQEINVLLVSRFFIKNKNAVYNYDTILNVFTRDIA